jgi:glutamate-5-semialdehyde dehydrogenase
MNELELKGSLAKAASYKLMNAAHLLNAGLLNMADKLAARAGYITAENAEDMRRAEANGMSRQKLDRLLFNETRIRRIADGIRQVAALDNPLGKVLNTAVHNNGLVIERLTVPLGVIGIIYEARPEVTADASALCLKAGNAVILRGGKEAFNTNRAVAEVLRDACEEAGLPKDCIQIITDTSRESALGLMRLNKYLDVIIPRGGAGLIQAVIENATVPAIETGTGNCHVYVDAAADLEMARRITSNAKLSRPSVCNAAEKLLVHEAVARKFLPVILDELSENGVEVRGDEPVREIWPKAVPIPESDWDYEYVDLIIGVKIVSGLDEAVAHINAHSSRHSDAIVTDDDAAAKEFLTRVDSAAVYHNASTRFTDGFEFGLGAEIGISTQKLHARGPMGLEALTSAKWVIKGGGQIRE